MWIISKRKKKNDRVIQQCCEDCLEFLELTLFLVIVPREDSSVQPGSLHCARRMSQLVYGTRFDWLLSQDRSSLSLTFPKEMKVFLATFTSGKPGELIDDIDWSDELFIGSSSTCSETNFEFAILRCPVIPCIVSSSTWNLVLDKQNTWREPRKEDANSTLHAGSSDQ